ncbi:hypothetical protein LTR37_021572, partial [Vermiconidia calcicola]
DRPQVFDQGDAVAIAHDHVGDDSVRPQGFSVDPRGLSRRRFTNHLKTGVAPKEQAQPGQNHRVIIRNQ